MNKEYEQEFLEGKLAVNCRTENQKSKFKKWVKSLNKNIDTYIYDMGEFGENTCYRYSKEKIKLVYADIKYYEEYNYEVVTYKEFMRQVRRENMYKYYVSYFYEAKRNKQGVGGCTIGLNCEINEASINEIQKKIMEENSAKIVIILNFIPLKDDGNADKSK